MLVPQILVNIHDMPVLHALYARHDVRVRVLVYEADFGDRQGRSLDGEDDEPVCPPLEGKRKGLWGQLFFLSSFCYNDESFWSLKRNKGFACIDWRIRKASYA